MGKKVKKKVTADKYYDHGPDVRKSRGDVEVVNNRAFVKNKHPLDYYRIREQITIAQHRAGLRLARDYAISHQHRSMIAMLSEIKGIIHGVDDSRQTAGDRYNKVTSSLSRVSSLMAWNVIITGAYLPEIHSLLGFSKANTGLDRFRECLDEIVSAYERLDNGTYDQERKKSLSYTHPSGCSKCGWPLTDVKIGIFTAKQCTRNSCGEITGIPATVLTLLQKRLSP